LSVNPALLGGLAEPAALARLTEHLNSDFSGLHRAAVICVWQMLRQFPVELVQALGQFEDGAILSILIDTFESDDVDLIRGTLIPAVLGFVANVRTAGLEAEAPFAEFLNSICQGLVAMSYRADQPIVESLAASCLKHAFPETFAQQQFY
jgi:hypothetical protein